MTTSMFMQVIEEVEERFIGIGTDCGEFIYVFIGKSSKKLLGFRVKGKDGKVVRTINFSDIDRMKKILESM